MPAHVIGQRILDHFLSRTEKVRHEQALLKTSARWKVAAWLERLAQELKAAEPISGRVGTRLVFKVAGRNAGRPVFTVLSVKGDLVMGTVCWSPQWHRPKFVPDPEAVYDQQSIAEIYARLR